MVSSVNEGYLSSLEDQPDSIEQELSPSIPSRTSPEWSDYVLTLFTEDELEGKNPKVDGLRRVAQILIGEIVATKSHVMQVPSPDNEYRATVEYTVTFNREYQAGLHPLVVFSAAADCSSRNTIEPYRNHPVATAETKAEGRALRKALGLKKVVSAEELTIKPEDQIQEEQSKKIFNSEEKIDAGRIQAIDLLCHRLDINAWAFVNSGKNSYDKLLDIPYSVSTEIIKTLNHHFQDTKPIPDHLKGYQDGWKQKHE